MKRIFKIKLIFILLLLTNLGAQSQDLERLAFDYFQGVKSATKVQTDLWKIDLYGPILLINPSTRMIYANEGDSAGALSPSGVIFTGKFPTSLNISGSWIDWNGKRWAMLPFPFPDGTNTVDAVGYICHELFHRVQNKLGFTFPNEMLNTHLDSKEGRIYLRLELEALNKALLAERKPERERHLRNALIFRTFRHNQFPEAKEKENLLELNEGITQYTTVIVEGRNNTDAIAHMIEMGRIFQSLSTYVRIFAYHTIPLYGYLLQQKNKHWNLQISMMTDLTDFMIKEFAIIIPENINEAVKNIQNEYDGEIIIAEEENRELKHQSEKKQFIQTLIINPHFEIIVKGTKMSFDPGNVLPMGDSGTIYKGNVRWSDKWGVLEVKSGLLVSADRKLISFSIPEKIEKLYAKGNGWELWVNEGYQIIKNTTSGNYTIKQD